MIILLSTRVEQIKSTLLQKKETHPKEKHLVSTENFRREFETSDYANTLFETTVTNISLISHC